jgi:predicted MFS family arabinose efflux permease
MTARVIAIVVAGMAVNIYVPVAPSLLGALVDYQGLSMDVAGRLISYNFWGGAAGSVFAIMVLHRPGWNLRSTMFACLMLVILTSGASVWFAGNVPVLAAVRFLNGVGAGLGFTVSCVGAIAAPRIERSYAILYGLPYLISGVGITVLPHVYRSFGIEGAFYGMVLLNILGLGCLPFFPKYVEHERNQPAPASRYPGASERWLVGLPLAALLLHYVFNSGIWTYFERIGVAAGMTPETAGAILGPSMGAAILGMIAASVLGDRLGYLRPIYIGIAAIATATLMLLGSSSEVAFGIGTAVFNASITFATPYMIAILALLVPSGAGVTAANVATIIGFSTGPFLVSFMVAAGTFTPAILVTAAGFIVVWILYASFARSLSRTVGHDRLKAVCRVWQTP